MTKLNIVYPHGKMDINIENFLNDCGVMRFKKLIRIIKMSYTPPVYAKQLKEYITDYLNVADDRSAEAINSARKCENAIEEKEKYLAGLMYKRGEVRATIKKILTYTTYRSQEFKLTKESEQELTCEINIVRDDLIRLRNKFRTRLNVIKQIERNTKNFKKYLELLKDV